MGTSFKKQSETLLLQLLYYFENWSLYKYFKLMLRKLSIKGIVLCRYHIIQDLSFYLIIHSS